MKITKRQLRRIIREERSRLAEDKVSRPSERQLRRIIRQEKNRLNEGFGLSKGHSFVGVGFQNFNAGDANRRSGRGDSARLIVTEAIKSGIDPHEMMRYLREYLGYRS